jgi:hypothetical protein
MSRLIDADALMQALGITNMECDKCAWFDWEWGNCKRGGDFEDACCAIENAPTIEERKKGKWTNDSACEFCGFQPWYERDIHTLNYCPNCGADMRGGQDERMDV